MTQALVRLTMTWGWRVRAYYRTLRLSKAGQPNVLQYLFSAERDRALKHFTLTLNGGRTIVVGLH